MRSLPSSCGTLHFVGIGGIGMSGIAEVMNTLGYKIQGSDIADSSNVQRLRKSGIRILIGHEAGNVKTDDGSPVAAVVISSAIKPDNPELQAARTAKIPVVRRAEMLAELMRLKWAVAIGGTHGKTTTTSMVGTMMEHAGFDPTVINGGIVNAYGTNTRLGKSDWMVVEADESDGTFTRLPAAVSIVTNIDPEHLDHYGTFDNIREAFRTFVENVPFYGFAVMCSDHPEVQTLVAKVTDKRVITYGFNPQADVRGSNVKSGPEGSAYDVTFAGWLKGGEDVTFRDVHLPMPGIHNVQNSLAALAVAYEMDVPQAVMKKGIGSFAGVKRRFTKTGETGGILVIDDYGHHPVEITAVLKAARVVAEARKGRVIAVMQPHRYTRLSSLFDSFCTCFNDADTVIVANVYAAGEQPVEGASRDALAQGIRAHGHRDVQVLDGADKLPALIAGMARENDMVVCLGAGDITQWAYALPGKLEEILASQKKQRA